MPDDHEAKPTIRQMIEKDAEKRPNMKDVFPNKKLLYNKIDGQKENELHRAAKRGSIDTVNYLLKLEVAVDTKNNLRRTALLLAARNGRLAVVQSLLEKKAYVGTTDKHGSTPLHYAAEHGYVDIVMELLNAGADPEVVNKNKVTALDLAKAHHRVNVVKVLEESNSMYSVYM